MKLISEYFSVVSKVLTSRMFIIFFLLCIGYAVSKFLGADNPTEEITEQILKLFGVDVEFSK